MAAARGIHNVLDKLRWMRAEHIWPNGLCYLWTDAFGVVVFARWPRTNSWVTRSGWWRRSIACLDGRAPFDLNFLFSLFCVS